MNIIKIESQIKDMRNDDLIWQYLVILVNRYSISSGV